MSEREAVTFVFHRTTDQGDLEFLMQRRSNDREHYPGLTMIPGGKMISNDPEAEMYREIREELGENVIVEEWIKIGQYKFFSNGEEWLMHLIHVISWSGEIINNAPDEGELEWVSAVMLIQYLDLFESKGAMLMLMADAGLLTAEHLKSMPDLILPETGVRIEEYEDSSRS